VPSSTVTLCDVPTSSRIDWGSYYTDKELRTLKLKHISLQDYPNHNDICHIGSVVCDSAVVDDEANPRVQEEVIKKGQLFESLNVVQLFLQDNVVHHHRPYYVAKSNKDVCYIIRCQISSCSWGVWLHRTKNEINQWKVSRVTQPHSCGMSEVWHDHPQCTTRFLEHQIMSIMWADSDITVATLIEVIHVLTTYWVQYDKAWRAKEHALALLWGHLERIIHKNTEIYEFHITLQPRHQLYHRQLWSMDAKQKRSILSSVEACILVLPAVCGWLHTL
jgi:hypothetical protein